MSCGQATDSLDYASDVDRLKVSDPALAATFAAFTGLEAVLNWLSRSGAVRGAVDIVGMDEFHYDFLVQLDCGRWAAFGVT